MSFSTVTQIRRLSIRFERAAQFVHVFEQSAPSIQRMEQTNNRNETRQAEQVNLKNTRNGFTHSMDRQTPQNKKNVKELELPRSMQPHIPEPRHR